MKDPGRKYTLRKAGFAHSDTAPLNVVRNPSVDIAERRAGKPIRPAVENEFGTQVRGPIMLSLPSMKALRLGVTYCVFIIQNKGFRPGLLENRSVLINENSVPHYDYNHTRYITNKGHDFK